MAKADIAQAGLARAVARFPEGAATLLRLSLTDPDFREVCKEYARAQQSITRFEASHDPAERLEISDCRTLIAEIENDIQRILSAAAPKG